MLNLFFVFYLSSRTIISDRDTVASSKNFRSYLTSKYGLSWFFLPKLSKSYLSERYIGFVKNRLSVALKRGSSKRWIDFVPALLKEYNTMKIEGTSYRRQAVTKENFDHFLSQLLGTDQPELLFNSGVVSRFQTEAWNRLAFRFRLGQKVLLSKRAEWKAKHKYHAFTKFSVEGGYSDKLYTVSGMQLRKTKGLKDLIAVYSLAEYGPSMHFYEPELKAIDLSSAEELGEDGVR